MEKMNTFYLILVVVLLISWVIGRSMAKNMLKKYVASLNAYINNLGIKGFKPTAIYALVVCMPHKRNMSMFTSEAKAAFSCAKTLSDKYKAIFSKTTVLSLIAPFSELPCADSFWYPQLGVFMDSTRKLFAVRTDQEETNPKVYRFSQLQDFAMTEDVYKAREWLISTGVLVYGGVYVGGTTVVGGKISGEMSMKIVFSGTNGPESVVLKPALNPLGEKTVIKDKINTKNPLYKLKCEELAAIAYCLQWIRENA
jgi:hypothetical protein